MGTVHGRSLKFLPASFALWMRLNFILSGESAWGWHLLCILKHVSVAVLLGLLVWKLLRDQIAASLAGTPFALHPGPNRIRSVGERTHPLMSICILAASVPVAPAAQIRLTSWS